MKKLIFAVILLIICNIYCFSQDKTYAKWIIDSLSAPQLYGRGYTNDGDKKAAKFIKKQFIRLGLLPFQNGYYQSYSFPINTFSGKAEVSFDDKRLVPGYDFLITANSPSINGAFDLIRLSKKTIQDRNKLVEFSKNDLKNQFVVIKYLDFSSIKDKKTRVFADSLRKIIANKAKGVINLKEGKLTWGASIARQVANHPELDVAINKFPEHSEKITLNIENKFTEKYTSQNVIGFIPGVQCPDTFIVFCAHYDHLGQMGANVYFPGANDNASGTAMVLDLARYFSKTWNQPKHSIAFMTFSGEEAGLLGSEAYNKNPLFSLKQIKLVVNLDMVGTGSDGITIVNGKVCPQIYQAIDSLNKQKYYLKSVFQRGESSSSDHYYFYKNNVPAIFIYTQGKEFMEYHNLYDISDKLPLTEYEDVFRLIVTYISTL